MKITLPECAKMLVQLMQFWSTLTTLIVVLVCVLLFVKSPNLRLPEVVSAECSAI